MHEKPLTLTPDGESALEEPVTSVATAAGETATIRARGVRMHNLKNVDVDIPRGKLVAVCGVSGCGKTSLALDTLYAEGQRRYIECFSAYTRQFLERIAKPDFDSIEGLPPSLAVTRAQTARGNRSTVGTVSEALDYLRLLMAHVGVVVCSQCDRPVQAYSPEDITTWIARLPPDWKLMLMFPVRWGDVGERASVLAELQASGFVRLLAGGRVVQLTSDRNQLAAHLEAPASVWCVVDRLRGGQGGDRVRDSLETVWERSSEIGIAVDRSPSAIDAWRTTTGQQLAQELGLPELPEPNALTVDQRDWSVWRLSSHLRCTSCGIDYPTPRPHLFSFNHALGACPKCEGFGDTIEMDMDAIVPDKSLSIAEGAIACWETSHGEPWLLELLDVADDVGIRVDVPFRELTDAEVQRLIDGDKRFYFPGLRGFFDYLETKKYKVHVRVFLSRYRTYRTCSACGGARLNPTALAFRIGGLNFAELSNLSIDRLLEQLRNLKLTSRQAEVVAVPMEQLLSRLSYLQRVGLGYLQLSRPMRTLSGGEAQRTMLTAALGSSLCHLLYVLDEPTVGLHPHDVDRLIECLLELSRRGNTAVVVEHEEALLRRADHVIEVGPGAGREGGEIVFSGSQAEFAESDCLTAAYLYGRRRVPIPSQRRSPTGYIEISGCRGHNLKDITVGIPLGVLCVVTGVSGSGKSSLVQDTLYPALANRLGDANLRPLPFEKLTGVGLIKDCILVDQSPVSRSPRSNPVTYVKAFDEIRAAFADTVEARVRGFTPGHFSFNSELGRCDHCKGDGILQVDMQFLADVHMTCPACNGRRFRNEVLKVKYRGYNVAEVLDMTVTEAQHFFRGHPKLQKKLQVLIDVGLGYLPMGQSATTLSAGEAQRLKLAGFLAAARRKKTLFILDEPTTGLHPRDIVRLLSCFDALLHNGHSLLVVEHNLHVIAAADQVIDLGPGAAEHGGTLVATGTPEEVAANDSSITGRYLKAVLQEYRNSSNA